MNPLIGRGDLAGLATDAGATAFRVAALASRRQVPAIAGGTATSVPAMRRRQTRRAHLDGCRGADGARFADGDPDGDLSIVDLNVRSTVYLAKLVLRDMAATGSGRVLFTSSVAATMPGSYQTVYQRVQIFHPVVRRSSSR